MKHPFQPILPPNARVLILGSFPSPASRTKGFYYGHPRNAFWRILEDLTGKPFTSMEREEKIRMLHALRIALWDAYAAAHPEGSSDSRLRERVPNDFSILPRTIRLVAYNGRTAAHVKPLVENVLPHAEHAILPSTSPAHTLSYQRKLEAWRILCRALPCVRKAP